MLPRRKDTIFLDEIYPIPLTIAFFDKDKKIIQIEDLEPYDEAGIQTNRPAKWALEVNKGWFDKNNVKIGDKFDMISSRDIKIRVLKQ